jgi:type II secretory pathway component PulJ
MFIIVSSLVSAVTLLLAILILRSAHRSEEAGDERLEILREQQQRLAFLNEELRQLLRALELERQEWPGPSRSSPEG